MRRQNLAEWVSHARRFVATGRSEFLAQAIRVCQDEDLRRYLSTREVAEGYGSLGSFRTLASLIAGLRSESKHDEAAMLEILSLRHIAGGGAPICLLPG